MKTKITIRLILTTICFTVTLLLNGQESAVDKLFDKYAYEDGFTTVYISEYMLGMFKSAKTDNSADEAMGGLKSIRILTLEDKALYKDLDFYKEVMAELPIKEYNELMVVMEKDQKIRMLAKEKNNRIQEFLMVGGGDDNFIISILGDIDMKTLSEISDEMDLGIPDDLGK